MGCFRDAICEHSALYILDDPRSSRDLYISLCYGILFGFIGPVFFFGDSQTLAERRLVLLPLCATPRGRHGHKCLFQCVEPLGHAASCPRISRRPRAFHCAEGALLRFLLVLLDVRPLATKAGAQKLAPPPPPAPNPELFLRCLQMQTIGVWDCCADRRSKDFNWVPSLSLSLSLLLPTLPAGLISGAQPKEAGRGYVGFQLRRSEGADMS